MAQIKESQPLEPPRPDLRQPGIYQDLRDQNREPFFMRIGSIIDQARKGEGEDNDGSAHDSTQESFEMSERVLLLIPSVDGSPTNPFEIPLSEAQEIDKVRRKLSNIRSQS